MFSNVHTASAPDIRESTGLSSSLLETEDVATIPDGEGREDNWSARQFSPNSLGIVRTG